MGDIVLTGHSLGGGVAQVIGSRLGVSTLVFSSPGVGYSVKRFGMLKEDTMNGHAVQAAESKVVNVVPALDVVPRVDLQIAVTQQIECRTRSGQTYESGWERF